MTAEKPHRPPPPAARQHWSSAARYGVALVLAVIALYAGARLLDDADTGDEAAAPRRPLREARGSRSSPQLLPLSANAASPRPSAPLSRTPRPSWPSRSPRPRPPPRLTSAPALADDCYHVYLDLGTNIGVQLHKLYNPAAFPGSPVRPAFMRYFGGEPAQRLRVCSFGWEPNPRWAPVHRKIEAHYRGLGANVTIFGAGAGVADGWARFVSDGDHEYKEWGGSVAEFKEEAGAAAEEGGGRVRIMNVVAWIVAHVLHRRIPAPRDGERPPAVVMKLDIEGSDEAVLSGLFESGALCGIDFVYTEFHVRNEIVWDTNAKLSQAGCSSRILVLDDEEYLTWELGQPLPKSRREWDAAHPLPKRGSGTKRVFGALRDEEDGPPAAPAPKAAPLPRRPRGLACAHGG